jgi:hypothetical protein
MNSVGYAGLHTGGCRFERIPLIILNADHFLAPQRPFKPQLRFLVTS